MKNGGLLTIIKVRECASRDGEARQSPKHRFRRYMRIDHQSMLQMNLLFQSACADNRDPNDPLRAHQFARSLAPSAHMRLSDGTSEIPAR
jgi:hypothetical protein